MPSHRLANETDEQFLIQGYTNSSAIVSAYSEKNEAQHKLCQVCSALSMFNSRVAETEQQA